MACVFCAQVTPRNVKRDDEKNDVNNTIKLSEGNHIDDLFRSKLAGRQVAYSAAAWSGASSMLDSHFKWLFIRKALYILLPIVVASGIGVIYSLEDSATYTSRHQQIQFQPLGLLIDSINTAGTIGVDMDKSELQSGKESKLYNHRLSDKTGAVATTVTPNQQAMSAASEEEASSTESDIYQPKEIDPVNNDINLAPMTNSIGALQFEEDINPYKHPSVSKEMASLKLRSQLDLMPVISFNDDYEYNWLDRESQTPAMDALRRIQLFAEGGVLGAQSLDRMNSGPLGLGLHARLLMKYHLGESVYLDLGIVAFNRNALPDGKPFSGNTSVIQINPTWVNYGGILLGTGYRLGARHAVGIGFEFNPLLAVSAERIETGQGEQTSQELRVMDNTGISTFDAGFVANYRISIAERLDATSELHFGFIDVTDNNVFDPSVGASNNTLLKLGLSYRITNR